MSLVQLTESLSNKPIHINTEYITAIFVAGEGEHEGKTAIGMINGHVMVNESYEEALRLIRGRAVK